MPQGAHRPDLDAIRGLATLAVVGFHAELGLLGGGFVGVDVFFVLSGYFIASSLGGATAEPGWVARFYARRARRLLPALMVFLGVATTAALLLLPPLELVAFGKALLASCVGIANVVLWTQTGYFSATAQAQPLLHLWSLAVEQQFYLLAPLLFAFRDPGRRRWLCVATLVITLVASEAALHILHGAVFYLAPFRAWEFLLGAALVLVPLPALGQRVRTLVGALGLLSLVAPMVLYSGATSFPGLHALVPCLGAAALIACGVDSVPGRLLARSPLRLIGRISYSLYLWHWPLIVFWRLAIGPQTSVAIPVLLSFLLAALSWRLVEERARARASIGALALASCVLALVGTGLALSGGVPGRVSADVALLDAARADANPRRRQCHGDDRSPTPWDGACRFGDGNAAPDVLLWGDSFVAELSWALGKELVASGRSLRSLSHSSCPPVQGTVGALSPGCREHNREVLEAILADPKSRFVVLVAHHEHYASAAGLPEYLGALRESVRALRAAKRQVVILGPVPIPGFDVPTRLSHDAMRENWWVQRHRPDRSFARATAGIPAELQSLALEEGALLVDPGGRLCASGRCQVVEDGRALYFDDRHLSIAGARLVAPLVAAALR
ncbi:MAG: acyltransferase [Deltaproteobacteria bacterium]|nr:acyltransferase [Deltaproteobacteria bacterium]